MKKIIKILAAIIFLFMQYSLWAQQNPEAEIRNLEEQEGQSWVKKDTATLFEMFSPMLVVNTPLNRCATLEDIKRLTRSGKIDIASSEKLIEKISFINDMAVVMGQDIVKPQGAMQDAGKTITRRYTDIWIKANSKWRLTIRQATIISIK